jgi:hypothetical protein
MFWPATRKASKAKPNLFAHGAKPNLLGLSGGLCMLLGIVHAFLVFFSPFRVVNFERFLKIVVVAQCPLQHDLLILNRTSEG